MRCDNQFTLRVRTEELQRMKVAAQLSGRSVSEMLKDLAAAEYERLMVPSPPTEAPTFER